MSVCPRCKREYIGYPGVSHHGFGDICPQCGKEEAFLDAGFKNAIEMAAQVQQMEDEMRERINLMNAGKLQTSEEIKNVS